MSKKKTTSWWKLQIIEKEAERQHFQETKKVLEKYKGSLCPDFEQVVKKLRKGNSWLKRNGILSEVQIRETEKEEKENLI